MPYSDWHTLIDEACVEQWASDLTPRTAQNYVYYFHKYLAWVKAQDIWPSAEAMLTDRQASPHADDFKHVDVLKQYLQTLTTGHKDRRNRWYAVRSFFAHYRVPLPTLPRQEMARLFRPSTLDKQRAIQLKPLQVDEVGQLVLHAPQPYKAALMVLFQSAMALAEFEQFNILSWKPIVDELDQDGPVRISLYRSKTSRTQVSGYYTFIGEDAKRLIRDWLQMRPSTQSEALFVIYRKNTRQWVPLKGRNIGDMILKVAKRIGLLEENALGRYHIHAHEFRDLFKSLCTLNGVVPIASEYFLGHLIDKSGYDKSPEYDIAWFKREYQKVEPQLNILSGTGNREDIKEEVTLEAFRRFAEVFGIDPMKIRIEKQRLLGRSLDNQEELELITNEIKKIRELGDDNPQIIVSEGELETYLQDGWEFVSVLPSQKILVRK